MADAMSTLKGLLGDNADEKIQNAVEMLKNSGILSSEQNQAVQTPSAPAQAENTANPASGSSVLTPEGIQFIGQLRSMVDQVTNSNDSRSNLLRSLKPFMRTDRRQTIDRAIRIMNIGRLSGLFGR